MASTKRARLELMEEAVDLTAPLYPALRRASSSDSLGNDSGVSADTVDDLSARELPVATESCDEVQTTTILQPNVSSLQYRFATPSRSTSLVQGHRVATGEPIVAKRVARDCVDRFFATEGLILSLLTRGATNISRSIANVVDTTIADDGSLMLVLDRPYGMDLHSLLRQRKKFSEPEARSLFRNIFAAICHSHRHGVALGALKLSSVRVLEEAREDGRFIRTGVVTDLQHAMFVAEQPCQSRASPAYLSPECCTLDSTTPSTTIDVRACDMWSLGIMLYALLVGRYPFVADNLDSLKACILQGQVVFPEHVSPSAQSLVRALLHPSPTSRATLSTVLRHQWTRVSPTLTTSNTGESTTVSSNTTNTSRLAMPSRKRHFEETIDDQCVPS